MSDPQPAAGKKQPRRAEPLQPDLPGRGADTGSSEDVDIDQQAVAPPSGSDEAKDSVERQKAQSETALENVRDGYK